MEMNKEVIDNLWTIVAGTEKQILVMEIFGDLKAYLVDSFSPKLVMSFSTKFEEHKTSLTWH